MLKRLFALEARGTTVAREVRGGLATFLTMAYILVANPAILAAAGVPYEPAVAATAASAALCPPGDSTGQHRGRAGAAAAVGAAARHLRLAAHA